VRLCLALLGLLRPWLLQATSHAQVVAVLLEEPANLYIQDIRKALQAGGELTTEQLSSMNTNCVLIQPPPPPPEPKEKEEEKTEEQEEEAAEEGEEEEGEEEEGEEEEEEEEGEEEGEEDEGEEKAGETENLDADEKNE